MSENEEFLQEFACEAKSHSEKIELGLLEMEKGCQTQDIIDDVFRSAHSIKGTASFFSLQKIVELAHAMESLLGKLRSREMTVSQKMLDTLLSANDELKRLIDHIGQSNAADIRSYIRNLKEAAGGAKAAPVMTQTKKPLRAGALSSQAATVPQTVPTDQNHQNYTELFKDLIKKGHKVYKLLWPLDENQAQADKTFAEVDESIRSIGGMIMSRRMARDLENEHSEQVALFVFTQY